MVEILMNLPLLNRIKVKEQLDFNINEQWRREIKLISQKRIGT